MSRFTLVVCPFCLQGFEPAWNCRLASCRHAYHSWCALTHFSESTKCIHKGCAKEMHSDWWISTGIPKPEFGKDGLVMAAPWERTPLTRNAFLTLPLICDWIHILKFREWVLACVGGGCCWGMFPGPRLISVKFVAISSGSKLISVFLTHLLLSSLFLNGWETSLPICVLSHYSVSECSYLWQIEFLLSWGRRGGHGVSSPLLEYIIPQHNSSPHMISHDIVDVLGLRTLLMLCC